MGELSKNYISFQFAGNEIYCILFTVVPSGLMHKFHPQNIQILDLGPNSEVYYHPTWLPFSTARQLFTQLQNLPFKQHRVSLMGTLIDQPRLTCWFGDESYTYSGLTITPDPWTPELLELRQKLGEDLGIKFNSVLANYYRDGSFHIGCTLIRKIKSETPLPRFL